MRVPVARRNLFADLTRLAISVGGVAVAILLIIILLGVYQGSVDQMSAYVNNVDADLWVAQAGSPDMLHSFSIVPLPYAERISSMDGVRAVYPLTSRTTLVDIGQNKNSLIVVGYQPENRVGGPWNIVEGRSDPGPGEIVADRVTMKINDLRLGDAIVIDGQSYAIVGVSDETTIMVAQYAFVDIGEARGSLGPDRVNFLVVQLDDPGRTEEVRGAIADTFPDMSVFTREQFARNNAAVIETGILPILAVIVVIAFVIGVIIVGLVVYSATLERYREYGVLKAVGASAGKLYGIVLRQAVMSSIIGYLVGAAASFGMARLVRRIVVQISVSFDWRQFMAALAAALVMSVLASYIPIRKINRIDPMIVFKA